MLLQCPNCGAIWGSSEIDWQKCDCCGYPDNDWENDEDCDTDNDDDDFDWEEEEKNPNDSRNL